uniref:Uncharacterized protein n=1 Tax=Nymphaea colorata TaxID=210225 RepID=A0A5K0UUT3_9MAGN
MSPPLHPEYFGNAIQSNAMAAEVGDLLKREIGWAAGLIHRGVVAHGDGTIRGMVDEWENGEGAAGRERGRRRERETGRERGRGGGRGRREGRGEGERVGRGNQGRSQDFF